MGHGSGYGKVILFNDHFVVHGVPGIVAALDRTTDATVMARHDGEIVVYDNRKGTKGYTDAKKAQQTESIKRMLGLMGVTGGVDVYLSGDLPVMSGLGCSAASSAAMVRATSDEYCMRLEDEEINRITYEMEKSFAGNPSGIDNAAAVYGGLLRFDKGAVQPIEVNEPFELVIADTGIVAETKAMVEGVARRKVDEPGKYLPLFKRAEDFEMLALSDLRRGDLINFGWAMDDNHKLLQELGVSSPELDRLVKIAKDAGAYGAKMTGGGGGGCIVALTPVLQEEVSEAIEKAGFRTLRAAIGTKGNSSRR
ncbi:MAG: mevalonate kinase [Candidatus Aenigmatarchaeota archaeon]